MFVVKEQYTLGDRRKDTKTSKSNSLKFYRSQITAPLCFSFTLNPQPVIEEAILLMKVKMADGIASKEVTGSELSIYELHNVLRKKCGPIECGTAPSSHTRFFNKSAKYSY